MKKGPILHYKGTTITGELPLTTEVLIQQLMMKVCIDVLIHGKLQEKHYYYIQPIQHPYHSNHGSISTFNTHSKHIYKFPNPLV